MSDDDPIKLADYRAGKYDDGDQVPCAKCGCLVHAYNTRCPHCGVHFDGVACDFRDSLGEQVTTGHRQRVRWIAVVLLVAIAVFVVATTVGLLC
jgi:hypothetical protein